jgi:hypothetical protein
MPKIQYIDKNFRKRSREIIEIAQDIIEEYAAQGFDLTLRQLYYQFVSRDHIPNRQSEYQKLGSIVNDARLAGLIDWNSIVDRTRELRRSPSWNSPSEIVEACANQYMIDLWEGQKYRPEVWIEKDALSGVISGICGEFRVPYFSCRGYTSQSEMWGAAMRMQGYVDSGQTPYVVHLGDHDPSGIDMTRDILDRLELFMGGTKVNRIALNMDQVNKYNPPPNPAKITDSRANEYIRNHGDDSWELDALDPKVISKLIRKTISPLIDDKLWKKRVNIEKEQKSQLEEISGRWDEVIDLI